MKNILFVLVFCATFGGNVKAQIQIPYFQNFEYNGNVLPAEMQVINADFCLRTNFQPSDNWQVGSPTIDNKIIWVGTGVYTDTNCASNDWLILGKFTGLNNFAICKWQTHSWYFPETYIFYVSTDSTLQSFMQAGAIDTFVRGALPHSFYEDSIPLGNWANQDIYIAFRCISASKFALGLDDITIVNSARTVVENSAVQNIKIYPTISSSFINVSIDNPMQPEVLIYNLQGQVLQRKENEAQQLDISALAAGVYIVEVRNGKDRLMQRVVKI